tara:strand:- start:51 stop:1070 length:1020 start_codon:yes stop_codon:yes gene_type:complete
MGLNEKFFKSAEGGGEIGPFFNTILITAGGNQSITGVGFKPDFVWTKSRTSASHNNIYDSVRGVNKVIYSNLQNSEGAVSNYLNSFDNDGFTLGSSEPNNSSGNSVAWCFNAGGSKVTNTNGSVSSEVMANTRDGFSIVNYTGATSGTVGHGLGVPPELIITKRLAANSYWQCYVESLGKDKVLQLNTSGGPASISNYWGTNSPTSNVFGLSTNSIHDPVNGSNIAYCFASVSGVSKVGTYTGKTTSVAVNTGFEPAFVMIKWVSGNIGYGSWRIYDNKRDTSSPNTKSLVANTTAAEFDHPSYGITMTSTGFTVGSNQNDSTNYNNNEYIYYAVAVTP